MKDRLTIDAGADIEQTEDATTRQNENISVAVVRLQGNGGKMSRLIDRIQQLRSIESSNNCFIK